MDFIYGSQPVEQGKKGRNHVQAFSIHLPISQMFVEILLYSKACNSAEM